MEEERCKKERTEGEEKEEGGRREGNGNSWKILKATQEVPFNTAIHIRTGCTVLYRLRAVQRYI